MKCENLREIACSGWCKRDHELRPLALDDAAICVRGGSCPVDTPTRCPWGTRGTGDCAEFGASDCDGLRCGCPTEAGRIIGARA